MPRIDDVFTEVAVYLYQSIEDAEEGASFGGSGFIASVPFDVNAEYRSLYAVTNRHVVTRAIEPVIRLNRKDGSIECVPTKRQQWLFHPDGDDIAVIAIQREWRNLKFSSVPLDNFITPQLITHEDIGIGDDAVMVGRFINHEGKQKNSPAARFGSIAMMDDEQIVSQESGIAQQSFLVETRSLPGYSGSPVFLYSQSAMMDGSRQRGGEPKAVTNLAKWLLPKGPYLLGIDWCHIQRKAWILSREGRRIDDGWYVEENTGMAGVIPAWKIAEVLKSEELVMQRKADDEEITRLKRNSPGGWPSQE